MIKYTGTMAFAFAEVPDEVTLCINVTNCPHHCEGCHSSYLREDSGIDLEADLFDMLDDCAVDITCVCLMGEGNDIDALCRCLAMIKRRGLKTCLYTGCDKPSDVMQALPYLDYLKLGHYDQKLGGLDKPTTNQRMYRLMFEPTNPGYPSFYDITWKFQPREE